MDGVLANFDIDKTNERYVEGNRFYLKKQPIYPAIRFAGQLSQLENVTVGILSNCKYNTQAIEKLEWLDTYMPFLKPEDINIISYQAYGIMDDKIAKRNAKCNLLNSKFGGQDCYVVLIDDDHEIISTFLKRKDNIVDVFHVSSIYVENEKQL